MTPDRVVIVDWSAAGTPKRGKDSIWIGVADHMGVTATNIPTRIAAEQTLAHLIAESRADGVRVLIGFDFSFGAPAGLARHLTGQPSALALWDWLGARVTDTDRNQTNYRAVAAAINATLPGNGPFWGNGAKADVPGLPRRKPALPPGLTEHRETDLRGRVKGLSPKPIWQLAGAGAVGAQSLTGIPVLARLRSLPGVAVWPFEDWAGATVVLAEVYASHLIEQVRPMVAGGMVADAAQVQVMARAFLGATRAGALPAMMRPEVPRDILLDEGWTLGVGHIRALENGFQRGVSVPLQP